jgi:hypothetical protein
MITLETVYALGGYDESKPDNNVAYRVVAYQTDQGNWLVHDEETDTMREPSYEEYVIISQSEVK